MQDREAHGQQGRGKDVPIQSRYADSIDYVWVDKLHTELRCDKSERSRIVSTANVSCKYITKFIKSIGGKGKVR